MSEPIQDYGSIASENSWEVRWFAMLLDRRRKGFQFGIKIYFDCISAQFEAKLLKGHVSEKIASPLMSIRDSANNWVRENMPAEAREPCIAAITASKESIGKSLSAQVNRAKRDGLLGS